MSVLGALARSERSSPGPSEPIRVSGGSPYGRKALEIEAEALRTTPEGGRNDRLNRSAFAMGQLVAGGELSDSEVREVLTQAARSCGLGAEIAATLESGLNSGMLEPRSERKSRSVRRAASTPEFWRSGLIAGAKDKPKTCLANVMHVLSMHPEWQGVFAWDAFGLAVVTRARPPMRTQDAPAAYQFGDWTDEDTARTAAWFATVVGFEPAAGHVDQAVGAVARKLIVHPVRDYLRALEWDGVPRLARFAADYLGAAPTAYASAVGRRWMVAAVARVFDPGCKVDSLLGLEGVQGIGKSSALRLLASPEWFADTGITIGDKDSYQALRRKWIYEFAELSSIRGKEIERVKNFLSSQVDTFRASYGRRTQDHPRQVIFAGSTNEDHYLADPTGARRFWPVRCGAIDLPALKRDRDQLWAEARLAFEAGEPWYLDTPELRSLAAGEQAEREERDDWVDLVDHWINRQLQPDAGVTTAEVLLRALNFTPDKITDGATKRVGRALRKLGFEPRQQRVASDRTQRERRYFRTCDATSDDAAADLGSCHTSQVVTGDTYVREKQGSVSGSVVAKPAVTTVTCDNGGPGGGSNG